MYPQDFYDDLGNLESLVESDLYKRKDFGIRVYRRGNLADFKDFKSDDEYIASEDIETFIFRSTFVGTGPELIRDLDPSTTMQFFS